MARIIIVTVIFGGFALAGAVFLFRRIRRLCRGALLRRDRQRPLRHPVPALYSQVAGRAVWGESVRLYSEKLLNSKARIRCWILAFEFVPGVLRQDLFKRNLRAKPSKCEKL